MHPLSSHSPLVLAALIAIFALAYAAIALEHPLKINKSGSALVGAGLLWTIYALSEGDAHLVSAQLGESLLGTAQIVFFLMGAMIIVEVVDAHNGFDVITTRIKTSQLSTLMWLVGFVTFFLSAILDNLTTTIVMISLIRKLLDKHEDRRFFAGIIVIAANSGGAWSPIGDVTTTMLWIGGQVTSLAIIKGVLLPSLVSMLVPLAIVAYLLRGQRVVAPAQEDHDAQTHASVLRRNLMFLLGLGILVTVPVFKTVTHLPPFMGILFGLGILLSVAALEHTLILTALAQWLDKTIGHQPVIVMLIGLASAIVDNVPLVAASMGMYSLTQYPPDHFFWQFLAYCAGTGGSILIIGSAAGVAAMGLERIHFFWYVKRISGLALVGYLAGAGTYLVQYQLLH
jgi:Na+/H+ antiporter NhaD/arsenite permease-like protein